MADTSFKAELIIPGIVLLLYSVNELSVTEEMIKTL